MTEIVAPIETSSDAVDPVTVLESPISDAAPIIDSESPAPQPASGPELEIPADPIKKDPEKVRAAANTIGKALIQNEAANIQSNETTGPLRGLRILIDTKAKTDMEGDQFVKIAFESGENKPPLEVSIRINGKDTKVRIREIVGSTKNGEKSFAKCLYDIPIEGSDNYLTSGDNPTDVSWEQIVDAYISSNRDSLAERFNGGERTAFLYYASKLTGEDPEMDKLFDDDSIDKTVSEIQEAAGKVGMLTSADIENYLEQRQAAMARANLTPEQVAQETALIKSAREATIITPDMFKTLITGGKNFNEANLTTGITEIDNEIATVNQNLSEGKITQEEATAQLTKLAQERETTNSFLKTVQLANGKDIDTIIDGYFSAVENGSIPSDVAARFTEAFRNGSFTDAINSLPAMQKQPDESEEEFNQRQEELAKLKEEALSLKQTGGLAILLILMLSVYVGAEIASKTGK